jgi:hypothetical protein
MNTYENETAMSGLEQARRDFQLLAVTHPREVKFLKAVNNVIASETNRSRKLQIFRTVDGQVKEFELLMMGINNDGSLTVTYRDENDHWTYGERASELDLKLLDQQAKRFAAQVRDEREEAYIALFERKIEMALVSQEVDEETRQEMLIEASKSNAQHATLRALNSSYANIVQYNKSKVKTHAKYAVICAEHVNTLLNKFIDQGIFPRFDGKEFSF